LLANGRGLEHGLAAKITVSLHAASFDAGFRVRSFLW
jgi:hypothetical protein